MIKKNGEITFPCQNQTRNKIFSPDDIIFSASGFKIIGTSVFQELMFVLRCSF